MIIELYTQNRKPGSELIKAIDPFISSLKEEDRQALKKSLSERMFGNFDNNQNEKVIDEHMLKIVTDSFRKVIASFNK